MLYNIFKRTTKKSKKKQKPKILADIHEKNSLVISELINNKEVDLEIKNLKIGDYLIGKTIIERKTVNDFVSSMINKRLIQQLTQMQRYPQKLLIIEGNLELENRNMDKAIRGFILSILTNNQIPIIFTQDYEDTSLYLITLAKQQLKSKTPYSLHSRIPKTLKEQKKYVLESFPSIGPKTSEKLLKEFKTLQNIFTASELELTNILKKQAKKFRDILDI